MDYRNNKYKKKTHTNKSNINIISGALLLLILTCLSKAPRNLIDKRTISILTPNNHIVNYLITFLIIYFVIDFAYQDTKHPFYEVSISILILSIYHVYVNVHYTLQITLFFILVIVYFLNDNINYETGKNNKQLIHIYSICKNILIGIAICILIAGYLFNLQLM